MTTDRVSTNLNAKLVEKIDEAAASHRLNRDDYIELILSQQLGILEVDETLARKLNKAYEERDLANVTAKEACRQRDLFKAKMEEAVESLAVADAKLKVYQKRSWLARLVGWKPVPASAEGMTLETLVRFHARLKAVGMTPKQIDQILLPLQQSAGVPLNLEFPEKAIQQIGEQASKQRSEGRDLR